MSVLPGWSKTDSPFHAGELAIQDRLGVRDKIDAQVRRAAIREIMPDQHRTFFESLPFIMAGTVDASGQPWASILAGQPGFIASPDPGHLHIAAVPIPGDPLAQNLRAGAGIGLLGIELPTRRRNRLNGTVIEATSGAFTVAVEQSFGNCPKYIQARELRFVDPLPPQPVQRRTTLNAADRDLVARAHTFFIATAHTAPGAGHGVDVSHRGGKPGFVRIEGGRTLTVPDFIGNFFFNTLGNLTLDPKAGLLFIDFATGDLLWIAATAEILWDGAEAYEGAERLLRLHVNAVVRLDGALSLRGGAPDYSPVLDRIGGWIEPIGGDDLPPATP